MFDHLLFKIFLILRKIISPLQLVLFIISLIFSKLIIFILSKSKSSIVICGSEIALNIYNISKHFSNSTSINFKKNKYYNVKYDFNGYNFLFNIFYLPIIFGYVINLSNNFYYIWIDGFFLDIKYDLVILKKIFNKKIITITCGDDYRSIKLSNEFYKKMGIDYSTFYYDQINKVYFTETYDNEKRRLGELFSKYGDIVFSVDYDPITYLTIKKSPPFFTFNFNEYKFNNSKFKNIEKIKIIHAPSSPIIKGTQLVRAAIKKLELEGYIFEYEEIIGKPNEYVKEALANSHILINHLYCINSPGLLGLEGMASKNAVLQSNSLKYMNNMDVTDIDEDCWVITGYWEVYDKLKWLLDNPELIEGYAERGRAFVERHYTIEKAREKFYKIFRENGIEI